MSTHLLLEAAARSLVMGAIILVALRLMRIEQVRARRTAWLLALVGALAMPIIGERADWAAAAAGSGDHHAAHCKAVAPLPAAHRPTLQARRRRAAVWRLSRPLERIARRNAAGHPARNTTPPVEDNRDAAPLVNAALSLAVFGYCVVAAMLSLRLCAGVGFALRLRNHAERVIFPFDPDLDVRPASGSRVR